MGWGVGLRFFSSSNSVMSEMSTLAKEVSLRSSLLGVPLLLLLLLFAGLSFVDLTATALLELETLALRWGLGCSTAAGLFEDVGMG